MSYFAVTREAGPGWIYGGINAQPGLEDHAAFMNALAEQGVVLLAGPLAGTEQGRLRALLIVNADSQHDIARRLGNDPWTISGHLEVRSIEPWTIFVGAERLFSKRPAAA
jgi:uncharacterized protein YciI